jgi:hypothetical protein
LEWGVNTETKLAARLHVYSGNTPRLAGATRASNPNPTVLDVGNVVQYTVTNLADGAWCFAATAYDTAGNESEFSNEVCTTFDTIPPGNPKTL